SGTLSLAPSPAVSDARATLSIPSAGRVRATLHDLLGRQVAVLHEGPVAAGRMQFDVPVSGLPAGMYVVRVEMPTGTASAPLVVQR
ncbi:MAG TPA: T9SS type A sorting domain-containing protein, partial [Rhodothermales bacterium]|nr:T9SS type A sorting domain-containing protein [Rhodothermales bacterium]